jgi:hypothetical protein
VGIHGPNHRHTREPTPEAARLMERFYRERMGPRYDQAIIGQALYAITEHNGMLRLRELERTTPEERVPWFCPSAQTPQAACARHHGDDAYTLGVVTHRETVPLALPAAMRLPLEYFGLRLDETGEPLPPRLSEISGTLCRSLPSCTRGFDDAGARWLASDPHRAAAVGLDKPGYVFSRNADSPWQAMLQALYACNHMRDNPRLCRVVAVDDRSLPDLGAAAAARARELLAAPPAPDARAVAAENAEPGAEVPWTYRKTDVRSPAPVGIEGVRRVDTAELARLLTQPRRPLLVDVGGPEPQMLPGALHFVHGGLACRERLRATLPGHAARRRGPVRQRDRVLRRRLLELDLGERRDACAAQRLHARALVPRRSRGMAARRAADSAEDGGGGTALTAPRAGLRPLSALGAPLRTLQARHRPAAPTAAPGRRLAPSPPATPCPPCPPTPTPCSRPSPAAGASTSRCCALAH